MTDALNLVITTAGLQSFTAAQADDDIDLTISTVGLTAQSFVVAPTLTALPGEFRRIDTISGEPVGDDIVHLMIRDQAEIAYSAKGFGLYLADGTLFAVYGQDTTIFEKSPLATLLVAVDVAFPTADIDQLTFGDTNFLNPPATTGTMGVVQLATEADADAGEYLVFLDDIDTGNLCGVGGPAGNSGLGSPSMGVAIVFLSACNGADRPTVAAHELLHSVKPATLLQGAPHLCSGDVAHVCDSSGDALYPYVEAGIPLNSLQLDVNHDDYWAGNAPVNLQVQPWFKHTQDQVHLALAIAGSGEVTSDIPGLDCTATCGSDWDRGDVIDLTPEPADGYRFIKWTGEGCSGVADCSLTLHAAKNVSALFAPDTYQLRVSVTGKGTVSSTPLGIKCTRRTCAKAFTSYYPVFLAAKPAKGWRLKSWTGACHGTKLTCRLGMTAPSAARATFVKKR